MIVGLVGLHGSGKSYLSGILEKEFGWVYINKRQLLERAFSRSFSSPESPESVAWYREVYRSYGVSRLIELVLERVPQSAPVILDAIHNPMEWSTVKKHDPSSMLVGLFSPMAARRARNDPKDALLDIKRVEYWHHRDEESSACLVSEIEWAFSGVHPPELLRIECAAFLRYLEDSGRML